MKRNPDTIYAIALNHQSPRLCSFRVTKITDKMFFVDQDSCEVLYDNGGYSNRIYAKQFKKDDSNVFLNDVRAREALVKLLKAEREKLTRKADTVTDHISALLDDWEEIVQEDLFG